YVDKMSMANGVEVRVPFLDKQVVEFSAKIPANYKMKRFETKSLLKDIALRNLPREIVYRKKQGFGVRLSSWLKAEEKAIRETLINQKQLSNSGLFEYKEVSRLFDNLSDQNTENSHLLFSIMCTEMWHAVFMDAHSPYFKFGA